MPPNPERPAEQRENPEKLKGDAFAALNREGERHIERQQHHIERQTRESLRRAPRPPNTEPPPSEPSLEDGVEDLSHGGTGLQRYLDREIKKSKDPRLLETLKGKLAPIDRYIQYLRTDDPLRESFSSDPDPKVNSLKKIYLNRVDSMLKQAQSEGLVMVYGGRLANRVAYADTWIRELDDILEGKMDPVTRQRKNAPFLTPQQRQYIQKVRALFQAVLDGDPACAKIQRSITEKPPQSEAMRKAGNAMKLLGLMAAAGMALLSGLLDIKNGRLSAYTLAWLGLTGWSLGYFKGRDAVVTQQLQFVRTPQWEKLCKDLGLKGKAGEELLSALHTAHRSGKKSQAIAKLLKENQQRGTLDRDAYIKILCGENPQGNDAELADKLKNINPQQLFFLARSLYGVTDPTALALLSGFVENGTNSESATAELTEARRANPPSASAPSGTPPGNLPQLPGTSTQF